MNSTKLPPQPGRNVRNAVSSQLLLTHALTGAMIAIIVVRLPIDPNLFFISILLLALLSGLIGALLTANLQLGLEEVEKALEQLKKGHFSAPLALKKRYWPLNGLRDSLNVLNGQLNHHLSRAKQASEARSQWLAQISEAAAQEERNRLARDLHDSIKQQIFSISIGAATVQARWENDPPGALRALTEVRRIAREAMVEMNAMLQQLRPAPLEKVGLVAALREQCEALQYRSGATVVAALDDLPSDDRFPPGSQEALFRIAQEAFGNIARHARATHVGVRLYCQFAQGHDLLTLEVSDNGQGFDTSQQSGGMGLHNMQERVIDFDGRVEVRSKPASGTTVLAWIPLLEPEPVVTPQKPDPRVAPLKKRAKLIVAIAGGLGILLVVLSPVTGMLINYNSRSFSAGNPSQVYMLLAVVLILLTMLTGYRYLARLTRQVISFGNKSEELYFRQLHLLMRGVFCVLAVYYLPILIIGWYGWEWMSWAAFVVCISFTLLGCYQYLLSSRITTLQYNLLLPSQRKERLEKERKGIKWSLITLIPILFNVGFTFLSKGDSSFFPVVETADLLPLILADVAVGLLVIYGINLFRVLEWRRGSPFEARVRSGLKIIAGLILSVVIIALVILAINTKFNLLYKVEFGSYEAVNNLVWSTDGKYFAGVSTGEGNLFVWNADGQLRFKTHVKEVSDSNTQVTGVAWANDNKKLAVVTGESKVLIRDIDGKEQNSFAGNTKFTSVAWSPDGTKIAAGTEDKTIWLWDAQGKQLAIMQGHTGAVKSVAWSPDSQYLASGSDDTTVRIWTAEGKEYRVLKGHTSQVSAITWSPDGKKLASSSTYPFWINHNDSIIEWSLDGAKLTEITANIHVVKDLRWSPDGRYLVSISGDVENKYAYINLWNTDGSKVASYSKNYETFSSIAWSPDSKKLAIGMPYKLWVWKVGH
ncbi:MAG TPA: histidine kinase [Chloroflexia bacterium]|nr:histidine kinase [Chloroflexia bacterium]